MASRDLWSHGSGRQIPDLLASALSMLLLRRDDSRPFYVASPYLSDFVLFRNDFGEMSALAPALADGGSMSFARYLGRLAQDREVRIVTSQAPVSQAFAESPSLAVPGIEFRCGDRMVHEKGVLGPGFYIEGSMNLTHSGVYVNGEKISYHTSVDAGGEEKIARAYLEFDRRWGVLDAFR